MFSHAPILQSSLKTPILGDAPSAAAASQLLLHGFGSFGSADSDDVGLNSPHGLGSPTSGEPPTSTSMVHLLKSLHQLPLESDSQTFVGCFGSLRLLVC